jgi:ATP-dependent protease ClpP protease subunit
MKQLFALVFLLGSSQGFAAGTKDKRTIRIEGVVIPYEGTDLVNDSSKESTELNTVILEILEAAFTGATEIELLLNTPGGVINRDSERLAKLIQMSPIRINCVIDGAAYSLGAFIFSQCKHRYATPGSSIMWHSAAVTIQGPGRINEAEAQELADMLRTINETLWTKLRGLMPVEYFKVNFDAEAIIPVERIAKDVPGLLTIR